MKQKFIMLLLGFVVMGCAAGMYQKVDAVRARNRQRLMQIQLGMSEAQVLAVMGTKADTLVSRSRADGAGWLAPLKKYISNPYRTSAFTKEGLGLKILYYYTDVKDLDGAVTDDELTPLVIINDSLAGYGWDYWNDTAAKYEIRIR